MRFKIGDIIQLNPNGYSFSKFTYGKQYKVIDVTDDRFGPGPPGEEIRLINDLGVVDWFMNNDAFFELSKPTIVKEILNDL